MSQFTCYTIVAMCLLSPLHFCLIVHSSFRMSAFYYVDDDDQQRRRREPTGAKNYTHFMSEFTHRWMVHSKHELLALARSRVAIDKSEYMRFHSAATFHQIAVAARSSPVSWKLLPLLATQQSLWTLATSVWLIIRMLGVVGFMRWKEIDN